MSNVQFPYPRKSSLPAEPKPTRSIPSLRPRDIKRYGAYILGGGTLIFFLVWLFSRPASTGQLPPGTPGAVIVTTLDPSTSASFRENIVANRKDYAARHGYATFFANTTDYNLMAGMPQSWSTVPALRHAMTTWPHAPWLFYLASSALIMSPHEPLSSKLLEPRKLESLMIVDRPVVPPDSVIRTMSHLQGDHIDFILTQDKDGLAGGSFLLRTGEWAKFFLDAWFDPLYRSYNFQKAENHALEHIVQWHGTILNKLALVPQRLMNSYTRDPAAINGDDGMFLSPRTVSSACR